MSDRTKQRPTASLTIRNLDEPLKAALRIRAARHGRSMEEEVRQIIRTAVTSEQSKPASLAAAIRARFADLGGVDLPEIPRGSDRETPRFD